jgi:hypothetical protein
MKVLFNPLYFDFIINKEIKQKPGTKAIVIPADGDKKETKIFSLQDTVSEISLFTPNSRNEYGEVIGGYSKITFDKREILALADKIREIESVPIPDGNADDDDLPF